MEEIRRFVTNLQENENPFVTFLATSGSVFILFVLVLGGMSDIMPSKLEWIQESLLFIAFVSTIMITAGAFALKKPEGLIHRYAVLGALSVMSAIVLIWPMGNKRATSAH